jgi:hypothetical protein
MADKSLEEIKRAERAEEVLNNPLFIEAVDKVRSGIINSMAESPLGDDRTHNRLVIAMQILNQIKKQLTDVVQTGKMAKLQVVTPMERVKRVFR